MLDKAAKGIIVNQPPLSALVAVPLAERYAAAFDRIGFAPPLAQAVLRARAAALPDRPVAIHIRGGDTIYGNHRFSSLFSEKGLCYPVAKRLMESQIALGRYPLVFGHDLATCRLLADRFGLRTGADFLDAAEARPPAEDAVAEIVAMSRCEEIYAGSSGFAQAAAWIGNRRLLRAPPMSPDDILADADLADPNLALPALQRAFSYYMAAYYGRDSLPDGRMIEALDKALHYDPGNIFYALIKARLHGRTGNPGAAEAALKDAVVHDLEAHGRFSASVTALVLRRVLVANGPPDKIEVRSYIDVLPEYASVDRPYTAYMAAAAAGVKGETDRAAALIALSRQAEPENPVFRDFPQ